MRTPPPTPPMAASNEAEPDELGVARAEGGAYARALQAMDEESGSHRAGRGLPGRLRPGERRGHVRAGGRPAGLAGGPTEANAHLEIAVANAGDGRFVPGRVQIAVPTFMRHDPVNGKRFADAVQVTFEDRRFTRGRKPSPDAQPRGADIGYAG